MSSDAFNGPIVLYSVRTVSLRNRAKVDVMQVLKISLIGAFLATAPLAVSAQMPKALTAEDSVIAIINGEAITERDLKMLLPQPGGGLESVPAPELKQLMQQLVTRRLLAAEATKNKLDQTTSFAAHMRAARNSALAQASVEQFLNKESNISEADMHKVYKENEAAFTREEISASHILLKSKTEADAVLKELKAGGDFAKLAASKSIGPSASRGGNLGSFSRGQMVPEFEKAAFALKVGELGGPVKTQFGYHVIKVTDKKGPIVTPFEQVMPQIRERMIGEKLRTYFKSLQDAAKIEIKDPRFAIGGE
jgi:peptidyl-prolyl cis-trans isomerase C